MYKDKANMRITGDKIKDDNEDKNKVCIDFNTEGDEGVILN